MAKNPEKRRCKMPACRGWAKRGHDLCAPHLRSRAMREHADLILPLLRAVGDAATDLPLGSLEVIDEELRNLFRARALFMSWIGNLSEREDQPRVNPTQFLRAWNDSTTRVIQLLRARRDLGGGEEREFGPLIDGVYDVIERDFQGSKSVSGGRLISPPEEQTTHACEPDGHGDD